MTVAELIAELEKMPADLPVQIVYDSAVCHEDIKLVKPWYPRAYMQDDHKGPHCIGLFDSGSADEITSDPTDDRIAE